MHISDGAFALRGDFIRHASCDVDEIWACWEFAVPLHQGIAEARMFIVAVCSIFLSWNLSSDGNLLCMLHACCTYEGRVVVCKFFFAEIRGRSSVCFALLCGLHNITCSQLLNCVWASCKFACLAKGLHNNLFPNIETGSRKVSRTQGAGDQIFLSASCHPLSLAPRLAFA